ncbi:MAG: class I SAM-dependent methyltransferase [Chthoniobacter sp.]|uniref:class I SAM-dependent methyltransferase n=1 Tax=Chthoniobacter sp. TaxID=2510640 RepID=UPI0032A4C85A
MRSPFSQASAQKIRELPQEFLLAELGRYFHAAAPPEIVEHSYSLLRCEETGLEFCDPPTPGNKAFYEWVSSFASYYPGFRWEYGEVARLLQSEPGSRAGKILDVGCGKGDFLRHLDFVPRENKYALDLNEPAIESCRAQGFNAFCGTVDTAIEAGFLTGGEFPTVTSFHCLEHVGTPVEFVRELLRATATGGRVFLSTPYSPMSFESDWFDIMNHPPHHMTRWNLASYQRLAEILGVKMRHFAPRNWPLKQALLSFRLQKYGPNTAAPRAVFLKDAIGAVGQILALWKKMRARQHENHGSDLILVEFSIP